MRYLCLLLLATALMVPARAQNVFDTVIPPSKTHYTYIGIQGNLLLQQFISFNSNASINTNPYVFCYARNNIRTGSGFAFGTGLNVSENSSDDGVSAQHVNLANVTFRAGYEKKYLQRQRFIPFWGFEFGMGVVYSKITTRTSSTFTGTSEITVETTKYFAGPSIRGGLQYAVTKHILLGTEFFINSQISTTRTVNSNNRFFTTNSFVPFNIGVQAPTALFLIFRY